MPKDAVAPLSSPTRKETLNWQLIEDPFNPVQVHIDELRNDPDFSKFLKAVKVGVPPIGVKERIR